MTEPEGKLRAVRVAEAIRVDILTGKLEPGQRLTFQVLCREHGVSVGVMREALIRLVDHGIVKSESHIGFRVIVLSDDDLLDLAALRAATEPAFLRHAVSKGSVEWESEVVAAHHRLERAPFVLEDGIINAAWLKAHAEFHLTLVGGSGNRRMSEITGRVRDEWDTYTRWRLVGGALATAGPRHVEEHAGLVRAALERDGDLAELLLRRHIESARTDLFPT